MGKVLITGTGRAGTTALIEIFSNLKLDTGFEKVLEHQYSWDSFAGLESEITSPHKFLKNPRFSFEMERIIQNYEIDYVIIPIRELLTSAKSREKHGNKNGGFMNSKTLEEQIQTNLKIIYNLTYVLSKNSIKFCFLPFPDFLENPTILYENLKSIFDDNNITKEEVLLSTKKIYKPDRITIK